MITATKISDDGFVLVIDGADSLDNFKTLVNRATNLWADAPAEIKKFADQITNFDWHDGPLQNYDVQDTSPKAEAKKKARKKFKGEFQLACMNCGKDLDKHFGHSNFCPTPTINSTKEKTNGH